MIATPTNWFWYKQTLHSWNVVSFKCILQPLTQHISGYCLIYFFGLRKYKNKCDSCQIDSLYISQSVQPPSSQRQVHEVQQSNPAKDPDPRQPGRVQYRGAVQEAGAAECHGDPGHRVRRHQCCSVHRLCVVRRHHVFLSHHTNSSLSSLFICRLRQTLLQ